MIIPAQQKNKYLAISYGYPSQVVFSQLIEYTLLMEEYGLIFDYNFMIPGMDYLKRKNTFVTEITGLRKKTDGVVNVFPAPFSKQEFFLKIYKNYIKNRSGCKGGTFRTFVHPRGITSAFIAYLMKKEDENVSYLYDMRGDSLAEYEFHASKSHMPRDEIEKNKRARLEVETKLIEAAVQVICVSHELKEIALERFDLSPDKISVVPCCADEHLFQLDTPKRDFYRNEYQFENKFVLIYCGGLNLWHCAEDMFKLASGILRAIPNAFFVVLTPHNSEAVKLAETFLPNNRYLINKARREDVPKYLLASDMGIILRKEDPVNRVSSPTKIAEYLISGLPVILSKNIGDYSQIIKENNMGIVLNNDPLDVESNIEEIVHYINSKGWIERQLISQYGTQNFSKKKFVPKLKGIYTGI